MLELAHSGVNQMQIGDQVYRFVLTFTEVGDAAAVVFSTAWASESCCHLRTVPISKVHMRSLLRSLVQSSRIKAGMVHDNDQTVNNVHTGTGYQAVLRKSAQTWTV